MNMFNMPKLATTMKAAKIGIVHGLSASTASESRFEPRLTMTV
jgi:hypothetical protein